MASRVELVEEKEGEHVDTTDYYFERIGEPIPIKPEDSQFDVENPPSQALAVSELRGLLFVAHLSGFYVARTKDVIDSAKELKEKGSGHSCSIEQLSVVYVPIGQVRILALSSDNSTLAVSVAADVHSFSVESLLNKELKPSFSSSLPESSFVKDIRWRKNMENSFLVVSDNGKLYYGTVNSPLKHVMDKVDAAEWSVKGTLVAVAKESSLSILSSTFDERLSIELSCKSWTGDCDENCSVKVDSIKWVRPDCIILGLFQLTADGNEENYLVQIVRSQDGKLTDATSKTILYFEDLFAGLIDDIVPSGSGPYLFLSYLEQYELAVAANRKNTDQHIVLLGWSLGEEKGEAAVVDIERDNFLPRIELQDNGDDNLIMGLCIDKVSIFGKVKLHLGGDEQRELSPYCVLMCLTLEGKLNVFHIASVIKNTGLPDVPVLSDEEEEALAVVPKECDLAKLSSGLEGNKLEPVFSGIPLQDENKKEIVTGGSSEIPTKSDPNLTFWNGNLDNKTFNEVTTAENLKLASPERAHSFKAVNQNAESQDRLFSLERGISSGELFSKNSIQGPGFPMKDFGMINAQKTGEHVSSSASFLGTIVTATPSQSDHNELQKHVGLAKESMGKTGSIGFQSWSNTSSPSLSSGKVIVTEESKVISSLGPFSYVQGSRSETSSFPLGVANVPGSIIGNLSPFSSLKDLAGASTSAVVSVRLAETEAQSASLGVLGAGKIESVPSIRSSQLSSQLNLTSENSPNQKHSHSKDDYRMPTQSGMMRSEPHLSKQFNNIKEMVKELDALLQSIEERGGFRDACTISQKSSVETLEQGMVSLSDKCRMWKGILDERLGDIELLLDKTVQVLARKIYMEGIVKQASDKRYWELWNSQKLSSELELKRKHTLKLNQDLTNQLIELERHFNTIELNKFGDNDGVLAGRRALHNRSGPSRCMQSLNTLHNTTNSQLVAAEHLSECLSKQMDMLSVESPIKQQSVKKELFQTIGIPYDDSFISPNVKKAGDTTVVKKLTLSSDSSASKDQSRRRQSSAFKSFDPETARRRRDSLDQSWARFEPPKTTIKRMLLPGSQKANVDKSSLLIDKQNFSPCSEEAAVTRQKVHVTPSSSLPHFGNKGVQDALPTQASESQPTPFRWANIPPGSFQSTGWKSPMQMSNPTLSSIPASHPITGQNRPNFTLATPASVSSYPEKPNYLSTSEKEIQSTQQSNPSLYQGSSISQMPSLSNKSVDIPNSNTKGTVSTIGGVKHVPTTTNHSLFDSSKNLDLQLPPSVAVSTSTGPSTKVLQFSVPTSKSQPAEKLSPPASAFLVPVAAPSSSMFSSSETLSSLSVPSFTASTSSFMTSISKSVLAPSSSAITSSTTSASLFSMPSTVPMSLSSMQLGNPTTSSTVAIDARQTVSSTSSSTSPSPVFSSSSSFSLYPTKTLVPMSTPSFSVSSNSESSKTEVQPPVNSSAISKSEITKTETPKTQAQSSVDTVTLKKFGDATAPAAPPKPDSSVGEFSQKPESAVLSALTIETPMLLSTGSQHSATNISSPASDVALSAQQGPPSSGSALFSAPMSTTISATGESLDVTGTEEDEMEEEAPEAIERPELSLGSFGGFGIGSTPNSAASKSNPFGAAFGNAATSPASSPFTMTVPSGGELFRPASFNFSSPQPSQPSQPTSFGSFSGGFGAPTTGQAPTPSGFGQPAQLGAGQQALGSVLGAFGQSRQIGAGLPGSGFASASGFGGGFANTPSTGGFSNAATGGGFAGGGFAGMASQGGGFAAMASQGGGFAGAASTAGGFAAAASAGGFAAAASAGGFAAAASAGGGFAGAAGGGSGGGFAGAASAGGGFGNQQGTGGFSAFGGSGKPPELFTQMRK
ncbi:hypothetical protein SLE2022_358540 [Rubroshorea leprosula]